MKITKLSHVFNSSRRLTVNRFESYPGSVYFNVYGCDQEGSKAEGSVSISNADTVDLAVELLEALAPERLAPKPEPKFSDTPVGSYLRNETTGKVARVVEWDDVRHGAQGADEVKAVSQDGRPLHIFQASEGKLYRWLPVEVEVRQSVEWWVVEQ